MIILNYKDFLNERISVNTAEILNILNKLRLDCKDKGKEYSFDSIKLEFSKFNPIISFEYDKDTSIKDWIFPKLGITYFGLVPPDFIIVFYNYEFKNFLYQAIQNDNKWNNFVEIFCRSIGHEMVHINQYSKILKNNPDFNIADAKGYSDGTAEDYYGNKYEIAAHAWEIYEELCTKIEKSDILSFLNSISDMTGNQVKKYSYELYKYYTLKSNTKIWKRLLTYIYDISQLN